MPHGAAEAPRAAADDGPGQAGQGGPESDPPLQEQLTQTQEQLGQSQEQLTQTQAQLAYSQEQLAQREACIKALFNEWSTAKQALMAARAELAQQQQQQAEAARQVCAETAV